MKDPTAMFFARHLKVALEFSPGKDSAACLWLLEPYWDRLVVLWANPGNPYPETLEYMQGIREMVPHFIEVRGRQPEWIQEFGYPTDILPVMASPFTHIPGNQQNLKLQPFMACCMANMWQPMAEWVTANEVTGVIRGQKRCDGLRSPLANGATVNGVEYFFPIEVWDNARVMDYLGERVPASYKRGLLSSLDCMNCTAYVAQNPGRVADLELIYPPAAAEVKKVYSHIYEESMAILDLMEHYHGV